MKKTLIFTLLFMLLLIGGCKKKEPSVTPTVTPTPTETPTPVPENPAETLFKTMSDGLDAIPNYFPAKPVDFSNGVGYDISLELNLGNSLAKLIGISGLGKLRLDGSIDLKGTLAAEGTLYLEDEKLVSGEMFTDFKTLFFNVPDYSNQFASYPFEEIVPMPAEQFTNYMQVGLGNDSLAFLCSNIKDLLNCFEPDGSTEPNCTIGTAPYAVTGTKYTLRASSDDLKPVLFTLLDDERTPDVLCESLQKLYDLEYSYLVFSYYAGENGDFACTFAPDTELKRPIVFASTSTGFRIHAIMEDGEDVLCYSENTGKNAATIMLLEDTAEAAKIKYSYDKDAFYVNVDQENFHFSIDYSVNGEDYTCDFGLHVEDSAMLVEASGNKTKNTMILSMSEFGQKLFDFTIGMEVRDYDTTITAPEAVDADTWMSHFNYNAMVTDMEAVIEKFPYLKELSSKKPNSFSNMTGYSVDKDGTVDFEPLEREVLTMNEPSTGYYLIELPKETKASLFEFASGYFESVYEESFSYYNISGNVNDEVLSYYCSGCDYYDNNNYNNCISLGFDAVSGELVFIYCYHTSAEETINMANEALKLLNVPYTVTEENMGYSDLCGDYCIELVQEDDYYISAIAPYFE